MGNYVLMDGTASIVSWEDCVERCNTIRIGGLKSTKIRGSERSFVGRNFDTRIDTCCIGSPNIKHHIFHSLTSCIVDELEFEMYRNPSLSLGNVGTNELAVNVVRTNGNFWCEDTRSTSIGREECHPISIG
jgi:hypothetical protein